MTVYFSVISWFLRNPTYHRSILIALVNVLEGLEYVVITVFFFSNKVISSDYSISGSDN